MAFLAVYILEAHPRDVWQMESNVRDNIVFASPKDYAERSFVAGACVRKLGIKFPAVIDGFENSTEKAYTGWPDRIYLIDASGRIAYKSRPGPFGFKVAELQTALERTTGTETAVGDNSAIGSTFATDLREQEGNQRASGRLF